MLPLETQSVFRALYGVLLLVLLIRLVPLSRLYMTSERFGGYLRSSPKTDWFFNLTVSRIVFLVWFASAILLTLGRVTLIASFLNFLFCFIYFIRTRWISVARGMGAPGFMTSWIGTLIFLLEAGHKGHPDVPGAAC